MCFITEGSDELECYLGFWVNFRAYFEELTGSTLVIKYEKLKEINRRRGQKYLDNKVISMRFHFFQIGNFPLSNSTEENGHWENWKKKRIC